MVQDMVCIWVLGPYRNHNLADPSGALSFLMLPEGAPLSLNSAEPRQVKVSRLLPTHGRSLMPTGSFCAFSLSGWYTGYSARASHDLSTSFRTSSTTFTSESAEVPGYLIGGKTGTADKVMGHTIPYQDGYTVYTLREPHGVKAITDMRIVVTIAPPI